MASFKDILSGTISSVMDKAKDVAESGAVRDIYEQGASRAKAYASIAKLSIEMNGDAEELKRIYAEIGRLYFEQNRDSAEGFFAPLFSQAEEVTQRVAAKEQEINNLKAAFEPANDSAAPAPDADIADFEQIVEATESDGAADDGKD